MSYEQGFLDALALVERKLIDKGLYNDSIKDILEEIRAAFYDKRAEKVMVELGI